MAEVLFYEKPGCVNNTRQKLLLKGTSNSPTRFRSRPYCSLARRSECGVVIPHERAATQSSGQYGHEPEGLGPKSPITALRYLARTGPLPAQRALYSAILGPTKPRWTIRGALKAAGHTVIARNLLETAWTADTLRPFFGNLPVAEWFNRTAPRIRDGGLFPGRLTEEEALAAMIADPLLIRRPLIACGGTRRVGFDYTSLDKWIGLPADRGDTTDPETCPRKSSPCPNSEES